MAELILRGIGSSYGTPIRSVTFPPFVGAWSWHWSTTDSSFAFWFVQLKFKRSSDGSTCYSSTLVLNSGPGDSGVSVSTAPSTVGGGYTCLDWDTLEFATIAPGATPAAPITLTIDGPFAVTYCAYGTQPNPDATPYMTITDTLIDLVVGAVLAQTGQVELIPYVETALLAIEGSVWIGVDCSTMPGAGPALDLPGLDTLSPATLFAWFRNAAWRFFCQCVPPPAGSPSPIDLPGPDVTAPVIYTPPTGGGGTLTPPPVVCDNTDLCSYLASMKLALQAMAAQVGLLRADVRLISRQHVPFNYLTGTVHAGLIGNGDFTVSGILAVSVQLTTPPYALGIEAGDPTAYFGAGWIASGPADGFRVSTPIRHNPQWIDVAFDDTVVGYSLPAGAVATITEFSRNP